MTSLTPKQQRFVEEYTVDFHATNAALRAGYSKNSAHVEGARLLKDARIQAAIAPMQAKLTERTMVTKERISRELERMAFADARRLFRWGADGVTINASEDLSDDEAAAVVEVSHTVTPEGGTIRVKMADKKGALMDLAKLHGHIIERRDVRKVADWDDLSDDELASLSGHPGASIEEIARMRAATKGTKH